MNEPTDNGTVTPKDGKNIVLCSDGTGNSGGKARGTNVWAIFNAVWRQPNADGKLPSKTQIAFYDDGVGTQKFAIFKMLGGAFGWGYSRNIRDLYRALVSAYEPGDSIYLFGYSRGAYTVRGLAGLSLKQGILNQHQFTTSAELDYAVWAVFRAYRDRYGSIVAALRRRLRPGYAEAYESYRQSGKIHHLNKQKEPETPLRFIGVWDTVDAVGLPFDKLTDALDWFVRFRFRDQTLHPNVTKARHAISIDDERRTFWPVMWDEGDDPNPERIRQVWFPGVHSNVGGGYPKDHMVMVALDWMMKEAADEGLEFYTEDRNRIREDANAHGKFYDSRAGLAAYYRYEPRDMARICNDPQSSVAIVKPKIHLSALRRVARATAGYAPTSLPEHISVVGTHNVDVDLAGKMADAFEATAPARADGFKKAARYVRRRRCLYFVFLAYSLGILAVAAWLYFPDQSSMEQANGGAPWPIGYLFDFIVWILPDYLFGFFHPLLEQAKVHWVIALIVVAVLLLLVILKFIFERASRRLGLDAWYAYRETVYPDSSP